MKITATLAAAVMGMATVATAHMEMKEPPPLRSKFNKFTTSVDYSMTSPLEASGSNFPCKGYNDLLGTPQGKSVTTYQPGETYTMTITGGASHNGGSCQASLSFDGGITWTVIHSYIGNCPVTGESDYDFTIPTGTPSGDALFAWTWFNQVGNREMYMNCASVTIGGSSKRRRSLDGRPDMFVANVGDGCSTLEGKDLEFPDPGPDVTRNTPKGETAPPQGSCASGSGGGSGGGGAEEPEEPSPEPQQPSSTAQPVVKPSSTSGPEQPASSASIPGGVFVTVTSSGAPAPAPTTLQTSAKTSDTPATPTGGAGGAGGSMAQGTPCEDEGAWNCVGGSQFQRCASGMWSAMIDMTPGTKCSPGVSDVLNME